VALREELQAAREVQAAAEAQAQEHRREVREAQTLADELTLMTNANAELQVGWRKFAISVDQQARPRVTRVHAPRHRVPSRTSSPA
jgi:hypothetical protein